MVTDQPFEEIERFQKIFFWISFMGINKAQVKKGFVLGRARMGWGEDPLFLANETFKIPCGKESLASGLRFPTFCNIFGLHLQWLRVGWLRLMWPHSLNEKIARLREENTEINDYIRRLENGLMLNEEEQLKLTKEVHDLLKEEK